MNHLSVSLETKSQPDDVADALTPFGEAKIVVVELPDRLTGDTKLIKAPNQKCPLIVSLRIDGNTISAESGAYDELFKDTMKALRYGWEKPYWRRKINDLNGYAHDRFVEAATRLLGTGFSINVPSELFDIVVAGKYQIEHTKWVRCVISGQYKGYFDITWWGKGIDYYKESKKLPGSIYSKKGGSMLLPPECVDECMDFADQNDFQWTDAAAILREKALEMWESAYLICSEESEDEELLLDN